MDQTQIMRAFAPLCGSSGGPSEFMSGHVLYYESVSISDRYVSQSLSCIISHRTARFNERVRSLMRQHHPRLLTMFFQNSPGQEMEFNTQSRSSRSNRHSSSKLSSHHLILKVLIRWHHNQWQLVQHQALVGHHQASWSSQR